jgi:glyoxylate reductase
LEGLVLKEHILSLSLSHSIWKICVLNFLNCNKGTAIAKRALAFGMKIAYFNRNRAPKSEEQLAAPIEYASTLDALLQDSDIVVVSVPLTPDTTGLFQLEQFQKMKRTALFVNIARGAIVNTEALVKALETKLIAGAALDVTDPEPLPKDHPLLKV